MLSSFTLSATLFNLKDLAKFNCAHLCKKAYTIYSNQLLISGMPSIFLVGGGGGSPFQEITQLSTQPSLLTSVYVFVR